MTLLVLAAPARAQWSLLDDHETLKGKTIVDVGKVTSESKHETGHYERDPVLRVDRYVDGKYIEWLQFSGASTRCVDKGSFRISSVSTLPALLLADSDGRPYLAVLHPDLGSVTVDIRAATPIACPAPFSAPAKGTKTAAAAGS